MTAEHNEVKILPANCSCRQKRVSELLYNSKVQ